MTLTAVPGDALLVKTSRFWEVLGIGGLIAGALLVRGNTSQLTQLFMNVIELPLAGE